MKNANKIPGTKAKASARKDVAASRKAAAPAKKVAGPVTKSKGSVTKAAGAATKARGPATPQPFPTDSRTRCTWCLGSPAYMDYHDREWGVPVHDERKLFEFLTLEGAQAGLSWSTILAKRDNYREAFAGFDPTKVARFGARDVARLMKNEGIVRNRLKIESTISNARAFLEVQKEFGSFDRYIWSLAGGKPQVNRWTKGQVPASTAVSDAMSKDLKKRGFRFVGSTICYAFMQAVGMVNDHVTGCFRYAALGKG